MNYLALAQRLHTEVSASGVETTVISPIGEWKRLVTWTAQAWEDIQREHNEWMWMRKTATFTTVASQQDYPFASAPLSLADFNHWYRDTFRIYDGSVDDELFLSDMDFDDFRNTYLYGTTRTTEGYPTAITVSPTKSLKLALIPDKSTYTVLGDYFTRPSILALDTDTPEMPEQYHLMIVWKAMMDYGSSENAPEVLERGMTRYSKLLTSLELNQLPPLTIDRNF